MKFIFRRCSSTHIGKLIKESLNTPEMLSLPPEQKSRIYKRFPNDKRTNSITDKWLKDALTRKDKLNEGKLRSVNLRLNVVLTTLQKLRTAYNPALYFALMSRIGTGHIKWINKMGRPIETLSYGRLPLEFYHELSNMLYSISLRPINDKIALAKFSLQLLDHYYFLKAESFTGEEKFHSNSKFLRNCAFLVVKSQSNYYLEAMKELFRQNSEGELLANLSQLAFYVETCQWTSVVEYLPSCLSDFVSKQRDRDIQILELFSPCLVKSLGILITQYMENKVCQILTTLSSKWNFRLDQHDSSNLVQLCENHSCFKVIDTLNKLSFVSTSTNCIGLENLPSGMNLKQCMNFLSKSSFQPFKQESFLQSLSLKLRDLPLNLEVWKGYINEVDNQMQRESISFSLRAFFIHILLTHLSSHRNFNFMLPLVEYMIYERNLWQSFMMTKNLVGYKESSSFNCLFHAMSRATSTKLTLLTLFNQLNKIDYQFSVQDFLSMFQVCKDYSDCDFFYFVFYNFLLNHSHELFYFDKFNGKFSWRLPVRIENLISRWLSRLEIDVQENTDRVFQITDDVGESYVRNNSSNSERTTIQPINESELRKIFREKNTFFHMDSELFQNCKVKRRKEVRVRSSFNVKDGQDNLELDLSYSKRLEDIFAYITSSERQQKKE